MRRREHPDKTFYRGNVELSDLVGCSNIEFLGYISCLDEMEGHGVISHSTRGGKLSITG